MIKRHNLQIIHDNNHEHNKLNNHIYQENLQEMWIKGWYEFLNFVTELVDVVKGILGGIN